MLPCHASIGASETSASTRRTNKCYLFGVQLLKTAGCSTLDGAQHPAASAKAQRCSSAPVYTTPSKVTETGLRKGPLALYLVLAQLLLPGGSPQICSCAGQFSGAVSA